MTCSFYYGDEASDHHACMNGYLPTANRIESRKAYLVSAWRIWMKKREFLDRLKAALMNRINSQAVVENVNYYEDYINTQVRMGMKEEEAKLEAFEYMKGAN